MFYLIGSRALELHVQEFTADESADWDIICAPNQRHLFDGFEGRIEFQDFDHLNNLQICAKYADGGGYTIINGIYVLVVNLHGLAALKRSHLWRLHKWEKNMVHYNKYLKPYMDPYVFKDALERQKQTIKYFGAKNPDLTKMNSDFFDDAVVKKYDHDMLHEIVAYYEKPLYTRLKYEGNTDKAWCEKDLWEQFSYQDKLKCVAEETHVIASERFLIPNNWNFPHKLAYFKALKKVCTTLCSGWFRDFAIDNNEKIAAMFEKNKFDKLQAYLNEFDKGLSNEQRTSSKTLAYS